MNIGHSGCGAAESRNQRIHPPEGERQGKRDTTKRKNYVFNHELTSNVKSARSKRKANADFAVTTGRTRQYKICDIGARNHEETGNCRPQKQKRGVDIGKNLLSKRCGMDGFANIAVSGILTHVL